MRCRKKFSVTVYEMLCRFIESVYDSGLFVPDITAEELYTAAKLSIEAGADGVNFFNARSLLKDGKLQVVSRINQEYNL